MTNVSRKAIHTVLDQAAKTIASAGGPNGRASPEAVAQKLKELNGTERELVDTFYKFMDHRDPGPGASVTPASVKKALTYAKAKLVDAYDLDKNGLSVAERTQMSKMGQLAAQLAELHKTPLNAAKTSLVSMVTPKWTPDALPALDPSLLSHSAKVSFDARAKRAAVNDLLTPPIARKLTAGGESFTVVAQFMHDSFALELYNANGRKVGTGSGWGTPQDPITWK